LNLTGGTTIFNATFRTANTAPGWRVTASTIAGIYYQDYVSAPVPVTFGAAVKLLILATNETNVPGTAGGKTGSIASQQVDSTFTVTALVTDSEWNVVTSTSGNVFLQTQDPYDVDPPTFTLVNGSATANINFHTAGSWTLSVATAAAHNWLSYSNAAISAATGTAVKLQILVPGETHVPGSPTGKTAVAITTQTSEVYFPVTVNVVDKYWNRNSLASTKVLFSADDPFNTLVSDPGEVVVNNGQAVVNLKLRTRNLPPNGWRITVATGPSAVGLETVYASAVSTPVSVQPGAPSQLIVLAPGEQYLEGSPIGKVSTMTPVSQTAGSTFTVTVWAADGGYNLVTTTSTSVSVSLNSASPYDDPHSPVPAARPLVNGTTNFSMILYTAENKQTKVVASGALSGATRSSETAAKERKRCIIGK
jgi:hypothetical protein